jgi:undecaprenyl-diphosphatase
MDDILRWDTALFELINSGWTAAWLDALMPLWREKTTWIPLYLALSAFLVYRFRKNALPLLLGCTLTVGVADVVSSSLVKPAVQRLRPCNTAELRTEIHQLVPCGSGYSFTSSHAANHFALAVFLLLTLGGLWPWIRLPLLVWASSIAYGQVYVGVHYPLDVAAGGLLGTAIASIAAYLFQKKFSLTQSS